MRLSVIQKFRNLIFVITTMRRFYRGDITIAGRNIATEVAFKNCALFTKCITKINETSIDDALDD